MLARRRVFDSIEIEEVSCRRGFPFGEIEVDINPYDRPELEKAPPLGFLVTLLSFAQAIMYVRNILAALYLH